jgi:hypothetical protein
MHISFPAVSPFVELIQLENRDPHKIILRDHSSGVTATAGQLLQSVSFLRNKLHATLLQNGMYNVRNSGNDNFIFIIAPPGWEYIVSILTIFSLGAGMSPQCKQSSNGKDHKPYSKASDRHQTRGHDTFFQARKPPGSTLCASIHGEGGGYQSLMCRERQRGQSKSSFPGNPNWLSRWPGNP